MPKFGFHGAAHKPMRRPPLECKNYTKGEMSSGKLTMWCNPPSTTISRMPAVSKGIGASEYEDFSLRLDLIQTPKIIDFDEPIVVRVPPSGLKIMSSPHTARSTLPIANN
jgi:hypothetical protein